MEELLLQIKKFFKNLNYLRNYGFKKKTLVKLLVLILDWTIFRLPF